jgi:hypothetical protein
MSKPSTAVSGRTRTGTYGDMPFPITLVRVPKMTTVTQMTTATQRMLPVRIAARDYLKNKFVSIEDGKKIYPLIRTALKEGCKVELSVKGIEVNGWFFDAAICSLYGEFPEKTVDENVEVVDILDVDRITLRDMKEVRKLYYYNREAFDERMSNVDPILDCSEDFDEEAAMFDDEEESDKYDYNNQSEEK